MAEEQELHVMPLTRRMAESESATAPLDTILPSNPAPSTTATSCFCRHAISILKTPMLPTRKYQSPGASTKCL